MRRLWLRTFTLTRQRKLRNKRRAGFPRRFGALIQHRQDSTWKRDVDALQKSRQPKGEAAFLLTGPERLPALA